jgi:hypothetical protein
MSDPKVRGAELSSGTTRGPRGSGQAEFAGIQLGKLAVEAQYGISET